MHFTDEELLQFVGTERRNSVGFGEGESSTLADERERALRFARGDVTQDIQTLANRSSAVSTDVDEAVNTALPDLVEIFIGGDDVATFQAMSAEDEIRAQEESDYVKHVVFAQNDGFLAFNTAFKDALVIKTGLFHWWWDETEDEERSPPMPLEQAAIGMAQDQSGAELEVSEPDPAGMVTVSRKVLRSKVCIRAVPPEDFTVAQDTVNLKDAVYCALRERVRVQALIARGVDPETARELKSYTQPDQAVSDARDTAGEQSMRINDGVGDLRTVEVRSHYIRLLDEAGEDLEIWRIDTDGEERVLISKEKVEHIPFGAITPYLNPHRFYGESVADKLIEIQKIKTTLLRMFLDEGYFALNQRSEVDMTRANEFTIPDLLNNVPNMPVRTNGQGVITPLNSGGLNFNALEALEYVSTMGEQRTGVVRNAQGLKPDTLHDTARGAIELISAAQKRVRYIARVFAETGVRDLFLGVHALLRQGYGQEGEGYRATPHVKIGQEWRDIDPASWPERRGIDVQVGVGSAGREHDVQVMMTILQAQREMMAMGLPVASPENVYNAAVRYAQVANLKAPERFFTDPKSLPPQEPKPDPDMVKAQSQMQLEQGKAQATLQLEQQKTAATLQLQGAKNEAELNQQANQAAQQMAFDREKMQMEHQQKMFQIGEELQMRREIAAEELRLKYQIAEASAHTAHDVGMAKVNANISEPQVGGKPG